MEERSHDHAHGGHGSTTAVLEKAADVGASLRGSPLETWRTAREGTQKLASALPEAGGIGSVKHFIQRHPIASTCAALVGGYMIFGTYLPFIGGAARLIRGR